MYNIAASEFCSESADTLMYKWDYSQFLPLEVYVLYNENLKQVGAKWDAMQADKEKNRKQGAV